MNEVKPTVIYERRKARQAKLNAANSSTAYLTGPNNFSTTSVFNPNASTSSLPGAGGRRSSSPEHQQWDAQGRAVNYAPDPTLYAPQPKRPPTRLPSSQPSSRTQSPTQMSERTRPFNVSGPVRQDTVSSNNSWNVPQGGDSYAMSKTYTTASPQNASSPASRAAATPPAIRPPSQPVVSQQQAAYSQPPTIAPPPYVPSPPASQPHSPITPQPSMNPFAVPPALQSAYRGPMSQQPTPTQMHFAQTSQVVQTPQTARGQIPPSLSPAQPHVYSQTQPQFTGGHIPEATEASYHTAQQGHSRPITMTEDAYAGYDGSPSLR